MAQVPIQGHELKLYYNATGSGSGATYTEVSEAMEVACDAPADEHDVTTRGAGRYKQYEPGHIDLTLTFTMLATRDGSTGSVGTILAAFIAAKTAGTLLGWAVKDGDIDDTGTQGWEFDGKITGMVRGEPLDGATTYDFTVRPCYSSTSPAWRVTS